MIRTVEILLVIASIVGAFTISSFFAVLPSPKQASQINLKKLASTTLQALDVDHSLSDIVFRPNDDPSWSELQIALSACLPPNIVYNLSVYEMVFESGAKIYQPIKTISNAEGAPIQTDASSYLVSSSNVTFNAISEKIGDPLDRRTLYVLNCTDSQGWWITGYTAESLAADIRRLLSPYFYDVFMVQNTTQLGRILDGSPLKGERLQKAVIVNTFGEAVPIPTSYSWAYDSTHNSYARYCYELGSKVRQYNWTWVSIVGYPLYYVTNTNLFPNEQNSWGIYGMKRVGAPGMNAFFQGLDNQPYNYDDNWLTGSPGVVYLSSEAQYYCNYYGLYPSIYQTSTRALPSSILSKYHLVVKSYIFDQVGNWIPGATFAHQPSGSFLAIGLTRTPDIRITAIGLLSHFKPRIYRSEYVAAGTSRLVVLNVGQTGGV